MQRLKILLLPLLIVAIFATPCFGKSDQWSPLKQKLVKQGFEKDYVDSLFESEQIVYSSNVMARKLNALMRTRLNKRKPKPKPEPEYMDKYLNPLLLATAYIYYRDNKTELTKVAKEYGVPGEVITAILLVETKLGRVTGSAQGFVILASMAMSSDLEKISKSMKAEYRPKNAKDKKWLAARTKKKADWAYKELVALIEYSHDLDIHPHSIPSSPYGAIGICQFMPSNARYYGKDGNNDGKIDLFLKDDAYSSIANFLKKHGWKPGISRKKQLKVIYRYNHYWPYARTILAVADKIEAMDNLLSLNDTPWTSRTETSVYLDHPAS